jgi:hypothetical protein
VIPLNNLQKTMEKIILFSDCVAMILVFLLAGCRVKIVNNYQKGKYDYSISKKSDRNMAPATSY